MKKKTHIRKRIKFNDRIKFNQALVRFNGADNKVLPTRYE